MFHVVPNLHAAMKAIAAGVDGIVAEGGEGGGFKSTRDVASMVLVPLVCASVDIHGSADGTPGNLAAVHHFDTADQLRQRSSARGSGAASTTAGRARSASISDRRSRTLA